MRTKIKLTLLTILSILVCSSFIASCVDNTYYGSDEETTPPKHESTVVEDGKTMYNVIFALATIPPVLSALDCINNGYPTYAIIERGKTYSGIDQIENFFNAGFDVSSNKSTGFTAKEFNDMVEKVDALNKESENAFFNFYVQDGTALKGVAIAANAKLSLDQFHIYMCEDGTGAYSALNNTYVKGKTVTETSDGVYDNYKNKVALAKSEFESVMAKTDNKNSDEIFKYNIGKAFALASLDNFTYCIQDEATIIDVLESAGPEKTKLLSSFGAKGYNEKVEYTLNLKYQKISEGVANLTGEKRASYLTLMYGDYYEDTYSTLTRTTRAGDIAPSKKLVYIGTRHNGYPKLATNSKYGIGGLSQNDTVPSSYEELDDKYKSPLLFATESDYNALLSVLNDTENYSENVTDEAKQKAQVACFNVYIDYIYNLKLTYALYGDGYDLIMKGHPREPIGDWAQWGNRYKVTYGEEQTYVYDELMDNALLSFHTNDSSGKYIGTVPYGTAAENLAYLGADIAICGLPSSTYNGYDTDVEVLFVLTETDQDIVGTGNATAASQVKERYEAGNLTFTDTFGFVKPTVFFNIGNIYKAIASVALDNLDYVTASTYLAKFEEWLISVHGEDAKDIDAQGFKVN